MLVQSSVYYVIVAATIEKYLHQPTFAVYRSFSGTRVSSVVAYSDFTSTIVVQSRDSENTQRNLEIAQIPRLRGTYTVLFICIIHVPYYSGIQYLAWLYTALLIDYLEEFFHYLFPCLLLQSVKYTVSPGLLVESQRNSVSPQSQCR